jgi:hypothetical protein
MRKAGSRRVQWRTYFAGISRALCPAVELAAEMMNGNASFHADQARRHVGKARFDLAM